MADTQNRIFVTGGTGFLGSYILRDLLGNGYTNIMALRRTTSPDDLVSDIQSKIEWIEGDVLDIGCLEEGMENADYVIHAAAIVSFDPKDKALMKKVNIEGTANMVNMALHTKAKRFVFVSSVAALGRVKSGMIIDETTEWEESTFNSNYGISKRLAELEVWRGIAEGLQANILNPSYIIGGGFWNFGPSHLFQMVDKGLSWYAKGTNGMVDVRDVAKMTRILMERNEFGKRYISCARNISYQELFSAIAKGLGKKPPKRVLKKWMGEMAWRGEHLRSLITGSKPIVTKETIKYSAHDFLYDSSRSIQELDMAYTKPELTISETCKCYLESVKEGKNYGILNRYKNA